MKTLNFKVVRCKYLTFFLFSVLAVNQIMSQDFTKYPSYTGNDLGPTYTKSSTTLKVWAPTAGQVLVNIYLSGTGGTPVSQMYMQKSEQGTWQLVMEGDKKGLFYTFQVRINDKWLEESVDPYARFVGLNGKRAMIGDLSDTNPYGWEKDKSPNYGNPVDAIIYELHVRDATISENSGVVFKGKYLGLTERGKSNGKGDKTGLDHIRELGVTHVHLLPSYDFYSVDESRLDKPQYNWGYDPLNYNVPEGSYSTNAKDPIVRIREFKQLIKTFHDNGINVVMDMVYNHTMFSEKSWFNLLVPDYYYRQNANGGFSNATACGNETASERPMMRKFILESLLYWMQEYHIDGFRLDLMGVHDIQTVNELAKKLRELKPDVLLYGEGWTAGASPLAEELRAVKKYAYKLDGVAVFSDDIRDGIKGSVFEHADRGFVSGKKGMEESVKFGIVASVRHPQVNNQKVNYSKAPYATAPSQVVTYCECHDNHTLWDKLKISLPTGKEEHLKEMHKLALSIVLTSQGISFLHAGTEFLRSKKGVENSFQSPDSINAIDWGMKSVHKDVNEYVKELIEMRKKHPAFHMATADKIRKNIEFGNAAFQTVSYTIDGKSVGDSWSRIYVVFNARDQDYLLNIPPGKWKTHVVNNKISEGSEIPARLNAYSTLILYQD